MTAPMAPRLACLLLCAFAAPASLAQRVPLEVQVRLGVDVHALPGIAAWQEDHRAALHAEGTPVAVVDDFPPFLALRSSVAATFGAVRVGVEGGFGSTGGRLHYADYSGEEFVNRQTSRTHAGVFVAGTLARSGPLSGYAGLHARVSFVRVDLEQARTFYDEPPGGPARERYRGTPLSIEPELGLTADVAPRLFLRFGAGYEVGLGGALRGEGGGVTTGAGREPVGSAWNGLRVGLALGTRL